MPDEKRPVIDLTIRNIRTLEDIQEWSAMATALGFRPSSVMTVDGFNNAITVSAFRTTVSAPE